jgi:hypothetical protein
VYLPIHDVDEAADEKEERASLEWKRNGLRHSFISFAWRSAKVSDISQTTQEILKT